MNPIISTTSSLAVLAAISLAVGGCGESGSGDQHAGTAGTHTHADGSVHDDHAAEAPMDAEEHEHDDVALEPALIGGMTIELAQGHGAVKAGQESHLVVKLPHNDNGATIVRAWIGTEDRTLSFVGKADYAPVHDDYDVHAMAPDPLPENVMWWIEIEKPDGSKIVGSARPILE